MNMLLAEKTLSYLDEIEVELKALALWQPQRPPIKALQSNTPFCLDTLRFEQWLQFILIERFKLLIENGQPLPSNISIAPMAEESFKDLGDKAQPLIMIIAQLDNLLSVNTP